MEILSFEIQGKFAHFRKYYGNNTALSYGIPPRTTIIGIIASILGLSKDSYYQELSHQNLKIGIQVLSPLKKSFHRLNYVRINSRPTSRGDTLESKFNLEMRGGTTRTEGAIQTPFEVVSGLNIKKDSVHYRIFLGMGKNPNLFNDIKVFFQKEDFHKSFNVSLGTANFGATVNHFSVWTATMKTALEKKLEIHSAGNSDQISSLDFGDDDFGFNHVEEELLPADFIGGKAGRNLAEMNRVLYASYPLPIKVELTGDYYEITNDKEKLNIQFLEYVSVLAQQEK